MSAIEKSLLEASVEAVKESISIDPVRLDVFLLGLMNGFQLARLEPQKEAS